MDKKVSVKDIAQELNISLCTVHKALAGKSGISEQRRQEVIDTAKRMGYTVNSVAQSLARKEIRIGVVIPLKWQSYFSLMKWGMEQEFVTLQKYKVYGVFYYLSKDILGEEQKKLGEWIRDQRIDAVIYCPSMLSVEKGYFVEIKKMGVPVFFAGDAFDEDGSVSSVMVDSEMSGKLVADFYRCIYPSGLRAAVFTGSLRLKAHQMKINAFRERVNSFGGEVVFVLETNDDDSTIYRSISEMCEKHINAIYVSTATSLPVCRCIEERGLADKISLVCTDMFEELKYYMKKNIVKACIYQNQGEIGKRVVRVAYEYLVNKNSYGADDYEIDPVVVIEPRLYLLSNIK